MPHPSSSTCRRWRAPGLILCIVAPLAGCATQACSQPDVVAYVNRTAAAHDLDVIGVSGRIAQSTVPGRPMAICSAWMLERNPGYWPGSRLPPTIRIARTYSVRTVAEGFEVRLRPMPPSRAMHASLAIGTTIPMTR